jgi:hypothetical protein
MKDKSGPGKRAKPGKQRRDDSEGFDVRSQYTPFFPNQQQPAWTPIPQYVPIGVPHFGNTMPNTYQNPLPPPFIQPPQQYHNPMMGGGGTIPLYNQMPQNQAPPNHVVQTQMTQVSLVL